MGCILGSSQRVLKNSNFIFSKKNQFYSMVSLPNKDECMEWIGAKNKKGYGHFKIKKKSIPAHRYSYEVHYGSIPKDMCVLHHCDNRKCVTPDHLFIGTYADNNKDRDKKGRFTVLRGEANGKAKLSNQQAREIKEKLKLGYKGTQLASEYNISTHTISLIKNKKQWRAA